MIVSLDWLSDYVDLPEVDVLEERLLLSGLNHESTKTVDSDTAVDLEVTSNRPDCLGHIGIAREVSVLFQRPLKIPTAPVAGQKASHSFTVAIDAPDMASSYNRMEPVPTEACGKTILNTDKAYDFTKTAAFTVETGTTTGDTDMELIKTKQAI